MKQRLLASAVLAMLVAGCSGDDPVTGPVRPLGLTVANAIGTDPVTGATIETNKDDYVPGEVVHVVGRGWAPGETVNLFMTEDPDTHDDVSMDVTADANGEFSAHFYDVQQHDLGVTFTLTATGATSGSRAVATFYDNLPITGVTINDGDTDPVPSGASIKVEVTGNVNTGGGNNTLGSIGVYVYPANGNPATATLLYCHDVIPDIVRETPGNTTFEQEFSANAPTDAGVYDVIVRTYGDNTCTTPVQSLTVEDAITVQAANEAPTADAGGPYEGNEGDDIALDGSGSSDPDGTIVSYSWDYEIVTADPGTTCSFNDATSSTPTITCTDDGTFTVKLTVTDDDGAQDEATTTLTVYNVAPEVAMTSPADGAVLAISDVSTLLNVAASFSDDGTNDTHTCVIDWGNGTSTAGTVTETNGSGTCSKAADPNPYTEAGVYFITVTVTDDDGDSGSATVMIVVYDPSAGFVTGGGWIDVAPGSLKGAGNEDLSGKGTFGFVSKYQKGATVPTGNTQFVFHAAGFNFHSDSYEWLVVNQGGTNAQYKGTGTVDGSTELLQFMLWATDGTPDTFRIKIFRKVGDVEEVIFDNGTSQAIAGGSIQIHTGGKGKK